MTGTVSAAELARRTRTTANVHITRTMAAMFLGFWLEHGIVQEISAGQYRLTDEGRRVAAGLLDVEPDERAA